MLAACLSRRIIERAPVLLALAPLPALAAALAVPSGTTLVLPDALLGLTFVLDRPAAMLLGAAALLWTAGAVYARSMLQAPTAGRRFAIWWLITLVGNLGVFIAADLVGFFIFFTISSLAAYGLVVHDATAEARRAGAVYIALAVLGEALLLMGFVLSAAGSEGDSLAIRDVVAALPTSPWRDAALTFLILGFGLKIGLVPLHVWMPLTYTAAPIAAAAVLSGAAVKAGVIGFIRFLPLETALPTWGEALAAIGFVSAFYGAAVGLTQGQSQDRARLLQREPDGPACGRPRHGAGGWRRRREGRRGLLCDASCAGQRRPVPGYRRGCSRGWSPLVACAVACRSALARPGRAAVDWRRTGEGRNKGSAGTAELPTYLRRFLPSPAQY